MASLGTPEGETIYPIPTSARYGRARDLFTIWFGPNLMMLTIVTGGITTTVLGLPLGWALTALLLGNVLGGLFMALHAAQGPRLGVPQMIQTRGQFGLMGAVPITAVIVLMYVGFAASNIVLGAQGLQGIVPALGRLPAALVIQALTILPAVLGYRVLHGVAKILSVLSSIAVVYCQFSLGQAHLPVIAEAMPHPSFWTGVLRAVSLAALWQIAYAPYVSDSSRHLPAGATGEKWAFMASFSGSVLGSVMAMGLGAAIGKIAGAQSIVASLAGVLGPAAPVVLLVLTLGIAVANAMNVYCGSLSVLTVVQSFTPNMRYGLFSRLGVTLVLLLLAFCMGIVMAGSFMAAYNQFLDLLMSVMVPWTAINLTDYYVLHRGEYDVSSFFAPDGGIYGRYNWPALLCYAAGILLQIPFLATALYTGPVARSLGGVDLSWVVGLLLTPPLYLFAMRHKIANAVS